MHIPIALRTLLLLGLCLSLPAVGAFAQAPCDRWIDFRVQVDEPPARPGLVSAVTVTLAQQGQAAPIATLTLGRRPGASTPTFSLLDASGQPTRYCIPTAVSGTIQGTTTINVTGILGWRYEFGWSRQVGDRASVRQEVYDPHFALLDLEIAAYRSAPGGARQPIQPDVGVSRQAGTAWRLLGSVRGPEFTTAAGAQESVAHAFVLVQTGLATAETVYLFEGKFLEPGGTAAPLNALVETRVPGGNTHQRVELAFDPDWMARVRNEFNGLLHGCGVPQAQADQITGVRIELNGGCSGAAGTWYDPVWVHIPSFCRHTYPWIALVPAFDPRNVEHGDSLFHEWTHHLAYVLQVQAPGGGAHQLGGCTADQNVAWDEAVCHFLGSHLTSRALAIRPASRDLVAFTTNNQWTDHNTDGNRQDALNCLSPQRPNPGSWVEDVDACALLELYTYLGFDPDQQQQQAFCRFLTDLQGFCQAVPYANRTGENFFAYIRGTVVAEQRPVVDQIALWYMLWTRARAQGFGPNDALVPVRLATATPSVKSNQAVAFTASARAFRRIVGQYRGYGGSSIRVRLVENGTQVGTEVRFAANAADPAFNFAAQLQNAWPNDTDQPVVHRVRAEVWGNFIDGQTDEVLGRSDEVVVTVEGKTDTTQKPPPLPGTLTITVKPDVMATEIFEAKLNLPPELAARVAEWSWYAGGYSASYRITDKPRGQEGPVLSFQYENPDDGKSGPATVWVVLRDAAGREIGTAKQEIQFRSVSFAGTAPDVWDVNQHPKGMNLKRKPQERTQPDGHKSSVTGNLDLKWCQHFCPKTMQELEERVDKDCAGWGRTEKKALTIGKFQGFVLETKGVSSRAWVNEYMTPQADCGASGRGLLMVGQIAIEVSYGVSGGGVDEKDIPFLQQQGEAAWGEIHSILASLSIVPDGKIAFTPYTGPKPTDPTPTVKLVLTPDKTKLRRGEAVDVTAVVENARPEDDPIRYTWNGDHVGSGAMVRFPALKPGKFTLSVAVSGARFPIGTVAKEFEVEALTVSIEKRSPPGDAIPFGADASFAAKVLSNGQPAQGALTFRWEPHPDVTWQPHEGTAPQAAASFPRPGRVRVWVSVLEMSGGVLQTAAEAQPIEFTVGLPKFSVAFTPPNPYVGQPTKAKVVLDGQVPQDRIDFNWEITNNGRAQTPTQAVREVTFVPRDRNKITVVVRARVPHYGDDLGSATGSVTAQAYSVTAKVLGPAGPPPPGFELVGKPGAVAAGQAVQLHADISPQPPSQPRFLWFAQNGVIDTPEAGKECTAHKSEPGACQIKVRVEDQEQNTLGEAFTSFDVTVSKEEIEAAKKKKALEEKLAQVKALVAAGKFEEAVTAVEEADAIDREGAWPARRELLAALKNLGKEATSRRDWAAARRFYSLAVRLDRLDNEVLIGLNNVAPYEKSDREVRAWAAEVEQLVSQGRLASAEPKIQSIQLWEKSLPPPMCPQAQAAIQRYEQALVGYRAMIGEAKTRWNDYFKRRDWEPALAIFRDLQRRELFKDDENWVGAMLDAIPKLAAEDAQKKAQAAQLKAEGEALLGQGKGQDAIGKFKQSLGYWPDPALEARVKELEARLARAQELAREGWACDQKNDLPCAIAKYEEAQRALPNPQIAERIAQLKARLAQQQAEEQQRKVRAKQLFGEGQACESRGDLPCAIGKYEQALGIFPDDQLAAHVRDLKARLAQQQEEQNRRKQRAAQLYAEGQACESRGELACAIAKYEEAVSVLPNDQLSAHIRDLRARMQAAEQENQRKLRARQLVEEGQACESRGDLRCAIAKYEGAVALLPNPQVSERIRVLKARLAQPPPTTAPPQNPAAPPKSLSTGNTGGVRNGPTAPTTFRVNSPARLVKIRNYHWNYGKGAAPGRIGVRRSDGAAYGPWPASGLPGQGGVANASWKVAPGVDLPPGTYTVVDSDPSTWACNDQSGGRGMSEITLAPLDNAGTDFAEVVPTGAAPPPPPPPQPPQPPTQPPPQPPPTSTAGVDIAGDWTVMGSFDLRIAGDGTNYNGTLLSVTPGMAEIHFKPGDTVLKLARASAHTFKGQRMQRTDDGTPSWKDCSIGEEAGVLYLGLDVREGDPADGMVYARRK